MALHVVPDLDTIPSRPTPSEEKITVTPEMIEAGALVLLCELGGAVTSPFSRRGLVIHGTAVQVNRKCAASSWRRLPTLLR
jgi:hypothetical protein